MEFRLEDYYEARSWPRPPEPFKYVSKKRELRVILKPSDRIIDDQRRVIPIHGLRAEFRNGEFFTDDPLVICALYKHPAKEARDYVCCNDDKTYVESKGQTIHEIPKITFSPGSQAMVTGANSTVSKTADELIAEIVEAKAPIVESGLSKEDVIKIIDDRLADAIGKIAGIVENAQAKAVKKPKVFTCTVCHKPYPSGVAVGSHMKAEHPDVIRK